MQEIFNTEIENATPINKEDFFLLIHGAIPESGLILSCRRVGKARRVQGRKIIRCPHCGARITDTEANTKVELFPQPKTNPTPCQFQLKCRKCNREVGVNIKVSL